MKHIKSFETIAAFNAERSLLDLPNVSLIEETMEISCLPIPPDPRIIAIFNITDISKPTDIFNYNCEGVQSFEIDGVQFDNDGNNSYQFNTTGEHIIKYTLWSTPSTQVPSYMFSGSSELVNVIIPSTVTYIGYTAFYNCTNLTNITIPNSVITIEDNAFEGCDKIESIIIPNNVTTIGDWAFYGCTALANVTMGNSVQSIGDVAFRDCPNLTSIVLPASVTHVGEDAFQCMELAGGSSIEDVYCYPNPADLTWDSPLNGNFKDDGSTKFHVYSQYLSAYQTKFDGIINVTYVGDLT